MNTTDSSVNEPPDEPLYVTWDTPPASQEPDYVPQMQLSLDLLHASQRLHNARMALARCSAALNAWPLELEWRRHYAVAHDELVHAVATYDTLVNEVRWLEWGLIQQEGP